MNSSYYLAFDIGNTQTVIGVFLGKDLLGSWRIETIKERTPDAYNAIVEGFLKKIGITAKDIKAFIVSNVVPPAGEAVSKYGLQYLGAEPIEVNSNLNLGIKIVIDNPEELGGDRIANAVAGFEEYGGPVIIVDFGTATTYDCINKNGEYVGGIILPGIKMSAEALYLKTAKLPCVKIKKPDKIIGKNTVDGINSGLIFGTIFQTEGFIREIKKELNTSEDIKVIATGGLSELVCKDIKSIDKTDLSLTLKGLRLILEKNIDK